jgi:hypothetical protein
VCATYPEHGDAATVQVLVLHLKRFRWSAAGMRSKLTTTVTCPQHHLDVSRYQVCDHPYRGLHVRGAMRRSRATLCRPVPNLIVRFATFTSLNRYGQTKQAL